MIVKQLINGVPAGNLIMLNNISEYDNALQCRYTPTRKPDDLTDLTKHWVSEDKQITDTDSWVQRWKLVDKEFDSEEERQAAIEESKAVEWSRIRHLRDYELERTDWYGLSDAPEMPENVKEYRQQLRDITDTEEDPFNIVFPENPLNLP